MKKLLAYLRKNKIEFLGLVTLLVIASLVRFYNLDKLAHFVYDQARDALFMKRILVDHKFRLISTQSSIPGLYNGPIYYYLMAPFLWIFRLNPIGIDLGIAFLGVLAVAVFYFLAKALTKNRWLSWLVALVFAVQPQIVHQSRFGWNPNPLPLFALIFIWGLLQIKEQKSWGWPMVFFSLAILLQLHYSSVCFLPVLIIWLLLFRKKVKLNHPFWISLILFLILMSPLLLFEFRHNFVSSRAILLYLERGAPGKIPPSPFLPGVYEKIRFILPEMVFGIKEKLPSLVCILSFLGLSGLVIAKVKQFRSGIALISLWLISGVLVASLYQGSFFNFYLTFLYPTGFLLTVIIMAVFYRKGLFWKLALSLLLVLIFVSNLRLLPIFQKPWRTIADLRLEAKVIADDSPTDRSFNIASILGGDRFDHNGVDYRYFVETFYHKKALDWEPSDYQMAEILYLVSQGSLANPLKAEVMEILEFQPKKILRTWELPKDIVIYKLGK